MEFGTTPNPQVRHFPSRKTLIIGVALAIIAVGTFASIGFASYAASPSTTTTSSTYNGGSGVHCPNMGSSTSSSSSSSTASSSST